MWVGVMEGRKEGGSSKFIFGKIMAIRFYGMGELFRDFVVFGE